MRKPNSTHDLHFEKPISRWDEAMPLGNGLLGLLIWGDGSPLRFSLDRGDLWDKRVAEEILDEGFTYQELIGLVESGKHDEVERRFSIFGKKPTPTKIPAGRIHLDFGAPCDGVSGRVNLYKATAELSLRFGDNCSHVTAFMHADEPVGYITVYGTHPEPNIVLSPPEYAPSDSEANGVEAGSLSLLGYPPAEHGDDGTVCWFHQRTCTDLEYAVVAARRKADDGSLNIAFTVAASIDGPNWLLEASSRVLSAIFGGLDEATESHITWWQRYWAESWIDLPDKDLEKQWYVTNYLLGSCSREGAPPMPLQGVWAADEGTLPPWKGDYHSDLNTQMSYWSYMKANHLSEGKSFVDFLWSLTPEGRKFARDFFDAPGICMPSVMSIDGKALGGWTMYSLCLTSQAWLCQAFDHYWLYSGDTNFLRTRAYPYLKESAECIRRWLSPGTDGKLMLPLSSSPEIHHNLPEAWLTPNSNHDLALLKYLFSALRRMADTLKNGESDQWRELEENLPELAVNEENFLMLSPDESLKESHRHHAHTMAIYPLNLLQYHRSEREKEIIDATIWNMELLGPGWWVGFSFPWMASLYARQGNGEAAAYQLKLFRETHCSPNGFNLNGDYMSRGVTAVHYRPFTLEANMAAADAVQEMLLQTYEGVIRVFPAIPHSWKEHGVSFHGFRGEGAVIVSAELNGEGSKVTLTAERDGVFQVLNSFGSDRILVESQDERRVEECEQGGLLRLELEAGETQLLSPHDCSNSGTP